MMKNLGLESKKNKIEHTEMIKKSLSKFFKFFSLLFILPLLSTLKSCNSEIKNNSDRFKKGVFEIPAGNGYEKTSIIRKDSLQIESYEKAITISTDSGSFVKKTKHIDTLYIKWKNNFFYTLKMKSPKKELDKDPIYIQITKVTDSSYNFTAKIGFSKFETKGTIHKVK